MEMEVSMGTDGKLFLSSLGSLGVLEAEAIPSVELDPGQEPGDPRVDSWLVLQGTSAAPAHNPGQSEVIAPSLGVSGGADKRPSGVSLAGICLPLWVSSTQHVSGNFRAIVVGLLTLLVGNQLHSSHFQAFRVEIVSKILFPKACDLTACAKRGIIILGGQADGLYGPGRLCTLATAGADLQQGNVIVVRQAFSAVVLMQDQLFDLKLHFPRGLRVKL